MGFFKNLLRMNLTRIGDVTGSYFDGCYISPSKKDGLPALMIYGNKIEDYVFNKNDIKSFNILETGVLRNFGNQTRLSNKYSVSFNDGKNAVITIASANSKDIEKVLY